MSNLLLNYKEKYRSYVDFLNSYRVASNAASGSQVDSNANVENKNVTTCTGELYKKDAIGINRLLMIEKITELYGEELAEEYIRSLDGHEIYRHDETNPMLPYCVSITMYPFLFDGLTNIGGLSTAPKNLDSFCGGFVNLVFAIASQFAGAVSTPEFLMYMDYFIRKEYGDNYYLNPDVVVNAIGRERTIHSIIHDKFSQVVYSLNQPAAARNFQSVFWNIAYFDQPYFNGMFEDFVFPDGTKPLWESVNWLQKDFMKWFNAERLKTATSFLSFPVETVNLLDDGKDYVDKEWKDFVAEMWAEGHSFFCYRSNSVDSLSSCCRLKNELQDNTFSFTLGAGGVSTGSKGVITININRLVQNVYRKNKNATLKDVEKAVREQTHKIHCYLTAYNEVVKDNFNSRMLPVYDAGYIALEKQYLTIGINGFLEGAEFLGIEISPNEKYFNYGEAILRPIYEENKKDKTNEIMFNTEFVPAENLGVKNAKWDKEDGYFVPRDCYNSYFYIVEDTKSNLLDKFILHGDKLTKYLDGGSALHANLEEHLTKQQYLQLLNVAIQTGCSYFTFNIPNTACNDCGYVSKHKLAKCPKCGSSNLDYITRVIGYLKRVSSFSEARQTEEKKRYYDNAKV
jgi:ribonucleoside-triphosphate reductase